MVQTQMIPDIQISQDIHMPKLGLGTWRLRNRQCIDLVKKALEAGYRHIDTASMYRNESEIGRAIAESSVDREDVFLTTKLWSNEKDDPRGALRDSLNRLQFDYVDLYLIHWPSGNDLETWQVFEDLYKEGLCRAIGVSNFDYNLLKNTLVRRCEIKPMVNQIEMHPRECDTKLLRYAEKEGIAITAYSPLAKAIYLDHEKIHQIADVHGKTPAQIMLRWSIEHGAAVIPKSAHPERIKENMRIFDFEFSEQEIRTLNRL